MWPSMAERFGIVATRCFRSEFGHTQVVRLRGVCGAECRWRGAVFSWRVRRGGLTAVVRSGMERVKSLGKNW